MKIWQSISSKTVFQCPFFSVREDMILYPSRKTDKYWILERNPFSIAIPLDSENNTYLVGQYRYAPGEYSWELPMGGSEKNEKMLSCAQRELLEETGITGKIWQEIGFFNVAPGHSMQKASVFITKELTYGQSKPTETEQLKVKKINIHKVYGMVKDGKITDGPTLAALLILNSHLKIPIIKHQYPNKSQ